MDDTVAITLFRHGITEGNERKEYIGWTDSPLTNEAIQMLNTYPLNKYDVFVTSDLGRCVKTMNILFPEEKPIEMSELREMNFGTFEGQTYEALKHDRNYQKWLENRFMSAPLAGESFPQFKTRVDKGWQRIVDLLLKKKVKRVFIVTHGGVIRYLLERFAPMEKAFWEWNVRHGTGFVLTFEKERLRRGERCISLQEVPLTEKEHG